MDNNTSAMLLGAFIAQFFIFICVFALIILIAQWKIYVKAGQPGWAVLIPIYSTLVMLKIIGKPWWWLLLMFIPLVNVIFGIWATNLLSKSFGKDEGFTVGLIFLSFIFYPILAFSSAQYEGPYGDPIAYKAYQEKKKEKWDFDKQ